MGEKNIYSTKKFAKVWHEHIQKGDILRTKIMNKVMDEAVGDLKGKIVLEAGCGDGFYISNLLKKNPKKIIGIDISKWLLEYAKKSIKSQKVEFYQMDLRKKLNFKDDFFDVVVSYNVLQEIKDISTPLKEMTRVLKPRGKMVISVVHPLYHLFVLGKETSGKDPLENLKRYPKMEPIHSMAIEGFEDFVVYRRPISAYINEIVKNPLKIIQMREVLVEKKVAKINKKYRRKIGLPVFLFFELEKISNQK